jgi:preprotein translocase, SecE subunit, bacterial
MSFIQYLKDTRQEMRHTNWPSKKQVVSSTILVIVVSVVVALFLTLSDVIFTKGVDELLTVSENIGYDDYYDYDAGSEVPITTENVSLQAQTADGQDITIELVPDVLE